MALGFDPANVEDWARYHNVPEQYGDHLVVTRAVGDVPWIETIQGGLAMLRHHRASSRVHTTSSDGPFLEISPFRSLPLYHLMETFADANYRRAHMYNSTENIVVVSCMDLESFHDKFDVYLHACGCQA